MKFLNLFVITALLVVTISCTLDKTDFESEIDRDVNEYIEFKEAISFNTDKYSIRIDALNGTFYKGYNEIRLKVVNTITNQPLRDEEVTFLPILTNSEEIKKSCPHKYQLAYNEEKQFYTGYVVYTTVSKLDEQWDLHIGFTDNNQVYTANQTVRVEPQTNMNLNMTSFVGNDGEQYVIALKAPQKPKVAENELVAGIYKYDTPKEVVSTVLEESQFSYSEVQNYTLLLDPRMPEASMGNHSSPNNKDLTQRVDGFYYGVVNYTMTGNWTLNFMMLNEDEKLIKGTKVPGDFTPGIEGVKSELHIDILF